MPRLYIAISGDRWPDDVRLSAIALLLFYCAAPWASSPVNFRKCFDGQEIVTHARFRPRVVKPMIIYRLLKDTAFGPEDIERLVMAYEQTLRALRLKDRNDPITQLVAEKIIAIGRLGIEDPAEISKLALKQLGPP